MEALLDRLARGVEVVVGAVGSAFISSSQSGTDATSSAERFAYHSNERFETA